jgi:drug/metabolite transporter (DMT)-like permease
MPLVTVLLDWIRPHGHRPDGVTFFGLLTGFVGVALLINPSAGDATHIDPLSGAALIGATFSWASGSIYSRRAKGAPSPLMAAGANMLMGGAVLGVLAVAGGELSAVHKAAISQRSLLALLYLIVFGSIIGFTAYTWLLRNTSAASATTYAYVNPVVAIILGWALGGERLTARMLTSAAVIICSVIMITTLPQARSWFLNRRARL